MSREIIRRMLQQATLAAFDDAISSLAGEHLYAVALTTDDGGMSPGLCVTTVEHHRRRRAAAAMSGDLSEPGYDAYLRWDTAEWRDELVGWEHFEAVARVIDETADDADDWFEEHIAALIAALAAVRAARGHLLDGVTLFVSVTDGDEREAVENLSATELNPPEVSGPFLRRYDG
ncbi:DUF4303 domain-containing protein [Microbacterium sp. NPDC077663]|uniref:DUF4303 domain-containing protein n=1 Tax=Microbacterium sp. NPDC077663 TaxID=3364189 RepID=UPI0037C5832C